MKTSKSFLNNSIIAILILNVFLLLFFMVNCEDDGSRGYRSSLLPGDCRPGVYPRFVMCPNEVDIARSRKAQHPYSLFYEVALNDANQSLPEETSEYDKDVDRKLSEIAKAAALIAILDNDTAMATKAVEALLRLREDWDRSFTYFDPFYDAFRGISSTVYNACGAYDLLRGGNFITNAEAQTIENTIGAVVDALYETWVFGPISDIIIASQTNYNTNLALGIGTAGLVLDNYPNKDIWINYAVTELNRFYNDGEQNRYLSEQGVCDEGPHYFNYGQVKMPQFAILFEYMKGSGVFYDECLLAPDDCVKQSLNVASFVTSSRYEKAHEWLVKSRLPLGMAAPLDEGTAAGITSGSFWQYINGNQMMVYDYLYGKKHYENDPSAIGHMEYLDCNYVINVAGEYMARVDFSTVPSTFDMGTTQNYEESGMVIFRNNFEKDGIYAAVLGENGDMISTIHNHADATSFMLFAYEEMLAMETGYYEPPGENGEVTRQKTSQGAAHNIILVDGETMQAPGALTSGGVDAYMTNTVNTTGVDYTEVATTYQNVDFNRSVVFAREKYLVVRDEVQASAVHEYRWRLHGFGGGTSVRGNYDVGSFDLVSSIPTWTRPKAKFTAVIDSSYGIPSIQSGLWEHEWFSSWEGTHNYIDGVVVTTSGNEDLTFLAVIFPEKAGTDFPNINVFELAGQIPCITVKGSDYMDITVSQLNENALSVNEPSFQTIETDGVFIWLSIDTSDQVQHALLMGGSYLDYNSSNVISHSEGTSVSTYNSN